MAEQQRSSKRRRSRSSSSGPGGKQVSPPGRQSDPSRKKKKRRSRPKSGGGGTGGAAKATVFQKALDRMPGADQERFVKTASARADLYEIFSIFFQQAPTTEILAIFKHSDFLGILKIVLGEEHQERWKKFYNSRTPLESFQIRLQREYNNLFLVPTSQRFLPRETAFYFEPGNQGKEVEKRQLESLLKFYRRIGLTPMAKFKDQPDHLSQMMHYMNVLGERERDHLKKKNASQLDMACKLEKEFVHRHLAPWITKFRERMLHATRNQFLRQIAETLEVFILQDAEWTAGMAKTYGMAVPDDKPPKPSGEPSAEAKTQEQEKQQKPAGSRPKRRRRGRRKKSGTSQNKTGGSG